MAIVAGFSFGYAHSSLVTDSPVITLQNLMTNKSLFYAELAGWSFIFILDVIVAIALYFFFRSASKQISLITAAIRIVYTLILGGIAIVHLFKVVPFLYVNNSSLTELSISKSFSHILLFEKIWSLGLIVFGLHLVGLGYLSVKSKSVHWILGYLLYLGGISYTFIHTARQLSLFNVELISSIEKTLALPMALAEMLLALWLIYNGFRKTSARNT